VSALFCGLLFPAGAQAQSPYQVLYSLSANRQAPQPLAGAIVQGSIFAFTSPDSGVTRVRFFLDDPALQGTPFRTESNPPFDFGGGSSASATGYSTATLPDGAHTISAELTLSAGGLAVIHATFTVANSSFALELSPATLSIAVEHGSAAVGIPVDLESTPPGAAVEIAGDVPWLSASATTATAPFALTILVDPAGLLPGSHVGTITATATGYPPAHLPVALTVTPPLLTVDTLVDESDGSCADGDCSLRDALALADADGVASEVRFAVDGTISLALGPLSLAEGSTWVDGRGRSIVVAASPAEPVLVIDSDDNRIEALAIEGGSHGAVIAGSGNILLELEVLAAAGGGIVMPVAGAERNTVSRCVFAGNGGLAIDLGAPGPGLGGVAVQGGIAAPVLAGASGLSLSGSAPAGALVEVYLAAAAPSGTGEGEILLASVLAAADGTFVAPLPGLALGDPITAIATDPAGNSSEFAANIAVAAPSYGLLGSRFANRSSPQPLAGRVISGPIYIFTAPDEGVSRVRFHLDDPAPLGAPFRVESNAPFDFAGGGAAAANPYATTNLADGPHTIAAVLELADGGTLLLESTFIVANSPEPPSDLVYPAVVATLDHPLAPVSPTSSGGPVESYSVEPPLPAGLALDPTSGAIAGTPLLLSPASWHTVTATNVAGSATAAVSVEVTPPGPAIIGQPASLAVCPGEAASFSVVVAPGEEIACQWRRDGAPIPGATQTSLWIAAVGVGDAGTYDAIVTRAGASTTSDAALLSLLEPPQIAPGAPERTVCPGAPFTLSSEVTGSPPIALQWRRDGAPIPGATSATLEISAATAADAGSYDLVATNLCGPATGGATTVLLGGPPAMLEEPEDSVVCPGEPATLSALAAGTGAVGYQWRRDGEPIPGATAPLLSLPAASAADAGLFDVVVTDDCGSTTSATAALAVRASTEIQLDPVSQTLCAGAPLELRVEATGDGPLAFQWRKDGEPIPGATGVILAGTASEQDTGAYDAVVTGGCGSATSATALVVVETTPAIISQPSSMTACPGETVLLTIDATGSEDLEFRWRKDGSDIPGATGATLEILSVLESDAGSYEAVVTNGCGTAQSAAALLDVLPSATIVAGPADTVICSGETLALAVEASGTPPFAIGWRRNGAPLPGAQGSPLVIAAASASDSGVYEAIVLDACGSIASAPATVLVRSPPAVDVPPAALSVCEGSPAIFTAVASGTPPLAFQWRRGGVAIPGETGESLVIVAATPADAGSYDVVVANDCGSTTAPAATLHVRLAPLVVDPPDDVTVTAGAPAVFTVLAAGEGPLAYQWYRDGLPIAGAVAASIVIPIASTADAGEYHAVVGNACGSVASLPATLVVEALEPPTALVYPASLALVQNVPFAPVAPSSGGGAVESYAIAPALPAGLVFHAGTGVIAGIPLSPHPATVHTVTASNAAGATTATLTIEVEGNAAYQLLVSTTPSFDAPVDLQGQAVSGEIYVRFEPTEGVNVVAFHLDDPTLDSPPLRVEGSPPFDLAGGSASAALPFDTTDLDEGPHLLTAVAELEDGGTLIVPASFAVRNNPNLLRLSPRTTVFHAALGDAGPRSAVVALDATDGALAPFEISAVSTSSAPWLSIVADSTALPASITVTVEPGSLAAGIHEEIVSVSSPAYAPQELRVLVAVDSGVPGRSHSVSRHGIVWTFASEVEPGAFANGDPYVVGPVQLLAVEPEWDGVHHGAMVNPVHGERQGYDGRFSFDPALRAEIPRILAPGDSLVSVEGWHDGDPEAPSSENTLGVPRPALRTAAVLTVLDGPVAPDSFRPPYGGAAKPLFAVSTLQVGLLPELPLPADAPEVADVVPGLERLWLDHLRRFPGRYLHPSENMWDYDRDIATEYNEAALLALCALPAAEREALLVALVQIGIDMHAILVSGATYGDGGGGFGSGRKWPVLFAGILLDDPAMRDIGSDYGAVHALEDCQTFFLGAAEAPYYPDDGGTSEFAAPATVGPPGQSVIFSLSADRADPSTLHGATVQGDIFPFAIPESGVRRVRFFLDNPAATGSPYRVENNPPYDLGGGSVATALPFDTEDLPNGEHSVTAVFEFTAGGGAAATATFTVANDAPALEFGSGELVLEASADGTVAGTSLLVASSEGAVIPFELVADEPWITVTPTSGSTPAIVAVEIDADDLDPGPHVATITATSPGHNSGTIAVTVSVPGDGGSSTLVVNSLADELDGSCDDGDCSLRDALHIASADGDEDEIRFAVDGTISLLLGPLAIAGDRTAIRAGGRVVDIDASQLVGLPALDLSADDCVIDALGILGATGGAPGISITGGDNLLVGNRIHGNSGSGIAVPAGAGARNTFRGNSLSGNGGPGIDLGADGAGNASAGPNGGIQPPVLGVVTTQSATGSAPPGHRVEVFQVDASGEEGETFLGSAVADGDGHFVVPISGTALGSAVTATATAGVPLGTPVWGDRHCFPQGNYKDPGNIGYRTCCTANAWVGAALGAHILGARTLWNHEPFFDYMDLYMAEQEPGSWERSWSDFAEEMWDAHRASYGPVWPGTADGGG